MQHTQLSRAAPHGTGLRTWKILAPLAPVLAVILWLAATFRLAMALLLAFHALIHTGFLTREPDQKPGAPPWPFRLDQSWILSRFHASRQLNQIIGKGLAAITIAAAIVAAAALLTGQGWWTGPAGACAITSLMLLGLYLHPMLTLGIAVDAFILSAIILEWPALSYLN
jgi:hypothetical protein